MEAIALDDDADSLNTVDEEPLEIRGKYVSSIVISAGDITVNFDNGVHADKSMELCIKTMSAVGYAKVEKTTGSQENTSPPDVARSQQTN